MCLAPNYSVVLCGKVDGQSERGGMYKVTRYSLTTGAVVFRESFPAYHAPSGMAMVTVAGTQCLAFSYE